MNTQLFHSAIMPCNYLMAFVHQHDHQLFCYKSSTQFRNFGNMCEVKLKLLVLLTLIICSSDSEVSISTTSNSELENYESSSEFETKSSMVEANFTSDQLTKQENESTTEVGIHESSVEANSSTTGQVTSMVVKKKGLSKKNDNFVNNFL